MTRRLPRWTAAALALVLSLPARADEPAARDPQAAATTPDQARAAHHADIRRLVELNGAGTLGVQVSRQMLGTLRPLIPGAPEAFWRELAAQLDPEALVERLVPIYAKHLDADEVKGLIAFYESPVGRKLVAAQPGIVQDSMLAGQAWGREIAQRVIRAARSRGLEVKEL